MQNQKRRFRPMGIVDILDEVIDAYKSNFVLLLGTAAIVYIPISLALSRYQRPMGEAPKPGDIARLLIIWVIEALVSGALAYGISERFLDRQTSVGKCYRWILRPRLFFSLIGAVLLRAAIVFAVYLVGVVLSVVVAAVLAPMRGVFSVGAALFVLLDVFILCVVPVLVFASRLALIEPAVVIESIGAGRSIARSWRLTKGMVAKIVAVYLIVFLVLGIILMMIGIPLLSQVNPQDIVAGKPIPQSIQTVFTILEITLTTLAMPILAATPVILYYDARIRKEAFDLEMLANELDAKAQDRGSSEGSPLPQERALEPPLEGDGE